MGPTTERIREIRFWECDACFIRFKDSTLNEADGFCPSCGSPDFTAVHGTKKEVIEKERGDVKKEEDFSPTASDEKNLDKYPYENYEEAKRKVIERDNFTCQVCGYEPREKKGIIKYCKKCFDKGISFFPIGDWKPPKKCGFRNKLSKCSECEFFRKAEVKVPPLTHITVEGYLFQFKLPYGILAHHLDGNPRNNNLNNLVTVCRSCNRRLVGKAEGWEGIKQVKDELDNTK